MSPCKPSYRSLLTDCTCLAAQLPIDLLGRRLREGDVFVNSAVVATVVALAMLSRTIARTAHHPVDSATEQHSVPPPRRGLALFGNAVCRRRVDLSCATKLHDVALRCIDVGATTPRLDSTFHFHVASMAKNGSHWRAWCAKHRRTLCFNVRLAGLRV